MAVVVPETKLIEPRTLHDDTWILNEQAHNKGGRWSDFGFASFVYLITTCPCIHTYTPEAEYGRKEWRFSCVTARSDTFSEQTELVNNVRNVEFADNLLFRGKYWRNKQNA